MATQSDIGGAPTQRAARSGQQYEVLPEDYVHSMPWTGILALSLAWGLTGFLGTAINLSSMETTIWVANYVCLAVVLLSDERIARNIISVAILGAVWIALVQTVLRNGYFENNPTARSLWKQMKGQSNVYIFLRFLAYALMKHAKYSTIAALGGSALRSWFFKGKPRFPEEELPEGAMLSNEGDGKPKTD